MTDSEHPEQRPTPTDPPVEFASRQPESSAPNSRVPLHAINGGGTLPGPGSMEECKPGGTRRALRASDSGRGERALDQGIPAATGEVTAAGNELLETRALEFPPWLLRLGVLYREGRLVGTGADRDGRGRRGRDISAQERNTGIGPESPQPSDSSLQPGFGSPQLGFGSPQLGDESLEPSNGSPSGSQVAPPGDTVRALPRNVATGNRGEARLAPEGVALSDAPLELSELSIPVRSLRGPLMGFGVAAAVVGMGFASLWLRAGGHGNEGAPVAAASPSSEAAERVQSAAALGLRPASAGASASLASTGASESLASTGASESLAGTGPSRSLKHAASSESLPSAASSRSLAGAASTDLALRVARSDSRPSDSARDSRRGIERSASRSGAKKSSLAPAVRAAPAEAEPRTENVPRSASAPQASVPASVGHEGGEATQPAPATFGNQPLARRRVDYAQLSKKEPF